MDAVQPSPRPSPPRPRGEAGLSILEVLIGAAILAVALLGHTASIFSEHKLSEAQRARSTALLAAEQFVERMRSTDDWTGLYGRLNTLRDVSVRTGGGVEGDLLKAFLAQPWYDGAAVLAVTNLARSDHAYLEDGRTVFPPQVYDPEFVVPSGIHGFHVVVDVPAAPLDGDLLGPPVLREDLALREFGLPSDLDGDGVVDDESHNDDYRAIPVIVHVRWSHADGAFEEFRVSTWLWGYR